MGRTQGKGCYCFVNGLLETQVRKLTPNYQYVVVDNEAGMEHISRGILPKVDYIILISDCSRRGVQAAGRIAELSAECEMNPKRMGLIVNRAPGGVLNDGTREEIEKQGLELLGVVPQNDAVYEYDCDGKPTVELPENSPVRLALYQIMQKLGL
jgi:CO dehydrogenase maturation factor